MRFPMRCDQYELRPEPAAPGKWRGGIGIIRAQPLPRRRHVLVRGRPPDRPAAGRLRRLGRARRLLPQEPGHAARGGLPAKVTGIPFAAGEFIEFREPNAAGYGDPLERDPEAVREDVLDDFTTIELARDAYGVVFADERTLELDAAATEARRAELRGAARRQLARRVLRRARAAAVVVPRLRGGEPGVRDRMREAGLKAYEDVADRLRSEILEGARPPGRRASRTRSPWREEFGVSRATVREALRAARRGEPDPDGEGRGRRQLRHASRASTTSPTSLRSGLGLLARAEHVTLEELLEARELLEVPAARLAARAPGRARTSTRLRECDSRRPAAARRRRSSSSTTATSTRS